MKRSASEPGLIGPYTSAKIQTANCMETAYQGFRQSSDAGSLTLPLISYPEICSYKKGSLAHPLLVIIKEIMKLLALKSYGREDAKK